MIELVSPLPLIPPPQKKLQKLKKHQFCKLTSDIAIVHSDDNFAFEMPFDRVLQLLERIFEQLKKGRRNQTIRVFFSKSSKSLILRYT